jgi:hypothetical protein
MQLGVVQQGNAHGRIGTERLDQQCGDGLLRICRGGAGGGGIDARRFAAREFSHLAQAAVGREGGAAGQHQGASEQGDAGEESGAVHCLAPPWCM